MGDKDDQQKDATVITVEFLNMNSGGLVRPFHSDKYGYIPQKEFEDVQKQFEQRKKYDKLGSILAPFVAVKVKSNGARNEQQRFNCYAAAQNTEHDRMLGTGMAQLGFILE